MENNERILIEAQATEVASVPRELLQHETDDETYLDTMSLQLDRMLQLIHGTQAWFEANPQYDHFTFYPPTPGDDTAQTEKYRFTVTRDTLQTLKIVATDRYRDLRDHSELAHAVAQDVVESWKKPEVEG